MPAITFSVVSGPWEDRTTLVNFSAPPQCWVSKFTADPARRRSSLVSSFLADGAVEAAAAYDDRELNIVFALDAGTDGFAAVLGQMLARTFARPQWVEFTVGDGKPLFYRTKAIAPDRVEDFNLAEPGVRTITFSIPADPFAVGLPERGSRLVPNDPTDGGMRFTIDAIKGDVPAPLRLDCQFAAPSERVIVGSSTTGFVHGSAAWLQPNDPDFFGGIVGGWTAAAVTDSTAIGGSRHVATVPSPNRRAVPGRATFANVTPGDYRLLVRMKMFRETGETAAERILSGLSVMPDWPGASWGDAYFNTEESPSIPWRESTWQWIDMGVMRLPGFARQATAWEPGAPATASVRFFAIISAAAGSSTSPAEVSLDHAILVPAPGGDDADGRLLTAGWALGSVSAPSRFVVSSAERAVYTDMVGGSSIAWSPLGGFPRVIPGSPTVVSIVQRVDQGGDSKTATTKVDYLYHPRYLDRRGD